MERRRALALAVNRGFSALGGQIVITILPVVVYMISHSMALAGMVLGARLLMATIFTPFMGVSVDRFNPLALMAASLGVRVVLFSLMAETKAIPLLAVLAMATAVFGMLEAPAVGALTPRLVSAEALPRTNAIISSGLNLAFVAGPFLGGVIIARGSAQWGFFAAAASQAVSLAVLWLLPSPPAAEQGLVATPGSGAVPESGAVQGSAAPRQAVLAQLRTGMRFAFADRFLRIMLTVYAVFILGLTAFNVLAIGLSFRFHMGSAGYGILIALQAVGMLAVTFVAAKWLRASFVGPLFLLNMPIQGAAIIGVSLSPTFLLCAVFACVQGIGWGMEQASVMTIIQQRTPSAVQGRVFGLFFSVLSVAETVGVSFFGWLGGRWGDSQALALAGTISLVFALIGIVLLRPLIADASPA